ncbi:MAG: peroxiredoxin-like family protein [Microscillaceae bacterium]|nr:peroxiredoxin-like family protein [Microscillaceae bacterium]
MKKLYFLSFLVLSAFLVGFAFYHAENPDKPEDVSPLLVGEVVPDVLLQTLEGQEVSLKEKLSQKQTVLIFYRGGWCPYCNRQLAGMLNIEEFLLKLNYQIIAVSPDKSEKLKETADKNKVSYTLLSDKNLEAMQQFGIAYKVNEEVKKRYVGYGIELTASPKGEYLLPVPTVMILDKSGKILFEYINPDYKERLDPNILLCAAENLAKD